MKVLVVIDMQQDFVGGALGSAEAQAIVPKVVKKVKAHVGQVIFTQDTHPSTYLQSQEGQHLPVEHCIKGTTGWCILPQLEELGIQTKIEKPTFGSMALADHLTQLHKEEKLEEITLIGVCTDICVISNAMILKAALPEVPIQVDSACCAGVTPESHQRALEAMEVCQIQII